MTESTASPTLFVRVLRAIYTVLVWLLRPLVLLMLAWRERGVPGHGQRLCQRLGLGVDGRGEPIVWLHAASVGEVTAAAPLVARLREQCPGYRLWLTTMTSAGAARARELFDTSVTHSYLPLDTPGACRRFLRRLRPSVGVVVETELWPNLYACAARSGVPLALVSARLSLRAWRAYSRVAPLIRATLACTTFVGAGSEADAWRLRALGAQACRVDGNLKFDVSPPADRRDSGLRWRREWAGDRPVWIAASTRPGEEEQVLAAHRRLGLAGGVLILVPRHAQRFAAVAEMCRREGWSVAYRSRDQTPGPDDRVLLGDTMGELPWLYAAADVAFVGGTLAPVGGHNLLEPAALGVPVLSGPYLDNVADMAALLHAAGAARVVQDAAGLAATLETLLADAGQRERMGAAARALVAGHRGAAERYAQAVAMMLD